jgi:orotate phosphoribosyltransferase
VNFFDKYRLARSPDLPRAIAEHLVPLVPAGTDFLAGLKLDGVPLATQLSFLTGKQLARATRYLRPNGAIVTHALCLLDELHGASALLTQHGVALTSLFTRFELIA